MDLKLTTITFADVAANYACHVWQRIRTVLRPLKFNWFKVAFAVFYFCYRQPNSLQIVTLQRHEAVVVRVMLIGTVRFGLDLPPRKAGVIRKMGIPFHG